MKLGLREKILLIALGVMLTALAALTFSFSFFYSKNQMGALQSRSQAIVQNLANQLDRIIDLGIRLDELHGFEEQCKEVIESHPDLTFAMIVSAEGEVVFHSDLQQMGKQSKYPELISAIQAGENTIFSTQDGQELSLAIVAAADKRVLGAAVLAFPRSLIDKERDALLLRTVLMGCVAVAFAMLILFFALSRYVIRPIMGFVDTIRRIRAGEDYSVRHKISGEGELDIMVRGFNDLIDEVSRREAELRDAKDISDAANRAKMEFLAVMSHEIRTPIHAMLGMAELLGGSNINEKQRRYVNRIQDAGQNLMAIVNGILDYSKLEAGQLTIQNVPFSIRETVENKVNVMQVLANAKNLQVTWQVEDEVPDQLVGDPWRLGQVIINLLSNSLKFTEKGGVEVHVGQSDGMLCLSLCDTGEGIDPDFIGRVFEPFSQADSSASRRHGGTGLGLAIVRQLCEAMGGSVSVQSRLGEGACFWIELPLNRVADSEGDSMKGSDDHG